MSDNTVTLDIPRARGTVELRNPHGIFYSVLIDGEPVKRSGGYWSIPLRGKQTGQLRSRGLIPGFATLHLDGELVYDMGASAPAVGKVLVFVPLILLVFGWLGAVLGVMLFFLSVAVVKNPDMPMPLRLALPLVNTFAAGVILVLLADLIG